MKPFAIVAVIAGLLGVALWLPTDRPVLDGDVKRADPKSPPNTDMPATAQKSAAAPPVVVDAFAAIQARQGENGAATVSTSAGVAAPVRPAVSPSPVAASAPVAKAPAADKPSTSDSTTLGRNGSKARFAMQGAGDPIQAPRTTDVPGLVAAPSAARSAPGQLGSEAPRNRSAATPVVEKVTPRADSRAAKQVGAQSKRVPSRSRPMTVTRMQGERETTAKFALQAAAPREAPLARFAPAPRVVTR